MGRFAGVLGAQAAVVLQHVGITPSSVTLVVESGGLFHGRRRRPRRSVTIIVLLELYAMVAHHSALVNGVQGSIVVHDLSVSSTAVAEVANVLWIECALQGGKTLIGLCSVWVIHELGSLAVAGAPYILFLT